ncbi:MAG: ligase-associated DNA damage response endonuclease PdeM [Rhodobacteraceae bacterium]|nr:ligase-associated DNA damage response endonuclease PdeM [Paracoccaceae bacterium]
MHDTNFILRGKRHVEFQFCNLAVRALASGALQFPELNVIAVADLHLGKSQRIARRGGSLLPPYETTDALARLQDDLNATNPATVICLGDSFDDDPAAAQVSQFHGKQIETLQRGCRWIWVCGNHDANPQVAAGEIVPEVKIACLIFRHIATEGCTGEISGHYHPKISLSAKGRRISRACFLVDRNRIILPAYGTYTGGMDCREQPLSSLMNQGAVAIATGNRASMIPMPAGFSGRRSSKLS